MNPHTDAIGQPIVLGDKVLWGGGKTQYMGLPQGEVVKLTPKNVTVKFPIMGHKSIIPAALVVVTKLVGP